MHFEFGSDTDLPPTKRDAADWARSDTTTAPAIVSLSDIHGYLDAARSALRTLTDHPDYAPIVTVDDDGPLHWADENYILVVNGDLIDRGPANAEVLELVARLIAEAPPGRVRVTLGNHEANALTPRHFGFTNWFSGRIEQPERRALLETIQKGHIVAAYQGYSVQYAHAGAPDPYDVTAVNESLRDAAAELRDALGTMDDAPTQRRVLTEYDRVLGVGDAHLKGPGAGLVWLDLRFLPADAPRQVVGHTRQDAPTQHGNVYCQNVIRNNLDSPGGEAVVVETPDSLTALTREPDGSVTATGFIST